MTLIGYTHNFLGGFSGGSDGKESWVPSLGQEDALEQEMATAVTFLGLLLPISLLSPDEKKQVEGR